MGPAQTGHAATLVGQGHAAKRASGLPSPLVVALLVPGSLEEGATEAATMSRCGERRHPLAALVLDLGRRGGPAPVCRPRPPRRAPT